MPTLESSILIQASQEKLFWLSQDYNRRLLWDKYLRVATLEQEAQVAAKGVEAYCESKKGIGMRVRYISFRAPTHVAMEMTQGPWIFRKFSGSWRFKPDATGRTWVFFRYNFQVKYVTVGRVLLNPFVGWLLRTDIRNRLQYFKVAVENGVLEA